MKTFFNTHPFNGFMSLPAISVEGFTFTYSGSSRPALRDIDMTVEKGEFVLIAGRSGCGKTTLCKSFVGLIPHFHPGEFEGRVRIFGLDVADTSPYQLSQRVGYVFQNPDNQIVMTTVDRDIAFGLENLQRPREEMRERIRWVLDLLGLSSLAETPISMLSGGEKQKVAVAGILAMQPSILLLDEPLASLDPVSAQEALRLIRRLADEGRAVLIIEHRVEDVLKIAPEMAMFMVDGEVRYLGPTAGLQAVVDYHEVKLPAPMIMEKARRDPPPAYVPPRLARKEEPATGLVEFDNVSFAYDDGPTVLHDVNLTIRRGDIIAILGPNGAGKTTLMKHAIGLLKPREGRVLLEGKDTRELSVAQMAHVIGYVFQSPSHMLFAATVRDELAFGPKNLGYDQQIIEEGVAQAVEILNLGGLEDYSPLALSFGQQKRVSIAAILAVRSRVLAVSYTHLTLPTKA